MGAVLLLLVVVKSLLLLLLLAMVSPYVGYCHSVQEVVLQLEKRRSSVSDVHVCMGC